VVLCLAQDRPGLRGVASEAAPLIELAAGWTLTDDTEAQMGLLRVRANLLALQGELEEAERLAP
jgi:hypothetical protein